MTSPLQAMARGRTVTVAAAHRGGDRPGAVRYIDPSALAPRLASRRRAAKARGLRRTTEQARADRTEHYAALVACVSHELRTPLTSVIGYTELLLCGAAGELTDGQRDMLERVAVNGDRLHDLVDALLCAATARLESEDDLELGEVVHQVVGHLESMSGTGTGVGPVSPAP